MKTAALILAVLAAALFGCSKEQQPSTPQQAEQVKQQKELVPDAEGKASAVPPLPGG